MYIQQIRQERRQVKDSDGRTRTEVYNVPESDAISLKSGGKLYETVGNGVFHVPDEVGRQLVGGLFADVSDVKGAPIRLGEAPVGAPEPPDEPSAPVNAAAPVPAPEEPTAAPAKKVAKRAAKKAPPKA